MSVGVFCNVSEEEAHLLPVTMQPLLRHSGVTAIVVVHTGVRAPEHFGELARRFSKVREVHRCFGAGYLLGIEEGGYDQCSARVFGLETLEEAKTDWIIQFDADEFLASSAIDEVLDAPDSADLVYFDYYTPLGATHYWFEPRLMRPVGRRTVLDPHALIWRRRLEARPTLCEITARSERNITRHCSVTFLNHPYWRIHVSRGLQHMHFHCMLSKVNAQKRRASRLFGEPVPAEITECMRALERLSRAKEEVING